MISRAIPLLVVASATLAAQTPPPAPPLPPVYFGFQVDKLVAPSPKNRAPEYPRELRASNVEGEVLAAFVVDSSGQVILSTFQVLKSSHDLFVKAVKDALPTLRFSPAEIAGRKVAQRVQMPFQFSIAPRDTATAHSSLADISRLSRRVTQTMTTQPTTKTRIAPRSPVALNPPVAGLMR